MVGSVCNILLLILSQSLAAETFIDIITQHEQNCDTRSFKSCQRVKVDYDRLLSEKELEFPGQTIMSRIKKDDMGQYIALQFESDDHMNTATIVVRFQETQPDGVSGRIQSRNQAFVMDNCGSNCVTMKERNLSGQKSNRGSKSFMEFDDPNDEDDVGTNYLPLLSNAEKERLLAKGAADNDTLVDYSIMVYYTSDFHREINDLISTVIKMVLDINRGYQRSKVPLRANIFCVEEAFGLRDHRSEPGVLLTNIDNWIRNRKEGMKNVLKTADVALFLSRTADKFDDCHVGYYDTIKRPYGFIRRQCIDDFSPSKVLGFIFGLGPNVEVAASSNFQFNISRPYGHGFLLDDSGLEQGGHHTIMGIRAPKSWSNINMYSSPSMTASFSNRDTWPLGDEKADNRRVLIETRFLHAAIGDESGECRGIKVSVGKAVEKEVTKRPKNVGSTTTMTTTTTTTTTPPRLTPEVVISARTFTLPRLFTLGPRSSATSTTEKTPSVERNVSIIHFEDQTSTTSQPHSTTTFSSSTTTSSTKSVAASSSTRPSTSSTTSSTKSATVSSSTRPLTEEEASSEEHPTWEIVAESHRQHHLPNMDLSLFVFRSSDKVNRVVRSLPIGIPPILVTDRKCVHSTRAPDGRLLTDCYVEFQLKTAPVCSSDKNFNGVPPEPYVCNRIYHCVIKGDSTKRCTKYDYGSIKYPYGACTIVKGSHNWCYHNDRGGWGSCHCNLLGPSDLQYLLVNPVAPEIPVKFTPMLIGGDAKHGMFHTSSSGEIAIVDRHCVDSYRLVTGELRTPCFVNPASNEPPTCRADLTVVGFPNEPTFCDKIYHCHVTVSGVHRTCTEFEFNKVKYPPGSCSPKGSSRPWCYYNNSLNWNKCTCVLVGHSSVSQVVADKALSVPQSDQIVVTDRQCKSSRRAETGELRTDCYVDPYSNLPPSCQADAKVTTLPKEPYFCDKIYHCVKKDSPEFTCVAFEWEGIRHPPGSCTPPGGIYSPWCMTSPDFRSWAYCSCRNIAQSTHLRAFLPQHFGVNRFQSGSGRKRSVTFKPNHFHNRMAAAKTNAEPVFVTTSGNKCVKGKWFHDGTEYSNCSLISDDTRPRCATHVTEDLVAERIETCKQLMDCFQTKSGKACQSFTHHGENLKAGTCIYKVGQALPFCQVEEESEENESKIDLCTC